MSTPGTTVVFCTACGAHNAPAARFCQSCGQAMAQVQAMPVTSSIAAYASHPYGGFWIRVVAWFVDGALLNIVLFPLTYSLGWGMGWRRSGVFTFGWFLSRFAFRMLFLWLYEAFMTSSSTQATLGKMLVGLRVTDEAGQRISFEKATIRFLAKLVSGFILGIGYLMVAFTDRKQGLHDMIAGTLVQKTR
jgi:uncharacterized RDD family membrane protein YckC